MAFQKAGLTSNVFCTKGQARRQGQEGAGAALHCRANNSITGSPTKQGNQILETWTLNTAPSAFRFLVLHHPTHPQRIGEHAGRGAQEGGPQRSCRTAQQRLHLPFDPVLKLVGQMGACSRGKRSGRCAAC